MRTGRARAYLAGVLVLLPIIALPALALADGTGARDPFHWMKPAPDISLDGHRVDSLFYTVTIMLAVLFLILCFLLFWPMLAHRTGSRHQVNYHHQGGHVRDLLIAAAISAAIFFVVDGTLLVHSYYDLKQAFWNFTDGSEVFRVEIMPQQWAWNIRYAGADGQFNTGDDIITLNDLHLPVGRRVLVQLKAKDVIHSFFLPNVRTKQDANPGRVTRYTFTPVKTGSYEIVCAEMCGLEHYKMRGTMTIEAQEDFERWYAEAARFAVASFDPTDAEALWGWEWEKTR
jgi:cytochrome c oxidase subunit 2